MVNQAVLKPVFVFPVILLICSCTGPYRFKTEGGLHPSTGYGENIIVPIAEPGVYALKVTGTGFEPVLVVHPPYEGGGEWDGSRNGVLEDSVYIAHPGKAVLQVRTNLSEKTTGLRFSLTMEKRDVSVLGPGEWADIAADNESFADGVIYRTVWHLIDIPEPGIYHIDIEASSAVLASIIGHEIYIFSRSLENGEKKILAGEIGKPGRYALKCTVYEPAEANIRIMVSEGEGVS
ncbi:MAG: hypothetical protein JW881_01610 [Spirochaetales bacterium]|nr:hypothetical protein [Spirochaetales bacterium]